MNEKPRTTGLFFGLILPVGDIARAPRELAEGSFAVADSPRAFGASSLKALKEIDQEKSL